jgi:hypothetical protein
MQNGAWYSSMPPASTQVPCGGGEHAVWWEAGSLRLPSHPDMESELVLAALGGDKPGCVNVAEIWGRHTEDLTVLAVGPRGPADQPTATWDDTSTSGKGGQQGGQHGVRIPSVSRLSFAAPMRFPNLPGHGPQWVKMAMAAELEESRKRTTDLVALLALGSAFQYRLAGHVSAAHADRLTPQNRPALRAALEGRLAPIAEEWIGIDPDQVRGLLHAADGWGSLALIGKGAGRQFRISLPAGWLSSVWSCGLALVNRHLVVAVERPGWPDARVLAVRVPGADPIPLDVHGTADVSDAAHWET